MDDLNQGYKLGPHIVSGTWKYLFPEEFEYFRFPDETTSSCLECPKVGSDEFHPTFRCCTYHPRIPNYLLGLALDDEKTKHLVEKMIKDGYATPEGMQHTPKQYYSSLNQNTQKNFGKDAEVLCRFLDQNIGLCQLYIYRNSVCSTFFCESDFEEDGRHFWERLQLLAGQLETALSQWCMDQLDMPTDDYFKRYDSLSESLEKCCEKESEAWSEMALQTLWGKGVNPAEFYRDCARLVQENKQKLFEICGEVELKNADRFEEAFRNSLPEPLRREMDSEGHSIGTPVPIEDLWYLLQKSQRDLSLKMSRPKP